MKNKIAICVTGGYYYNWQYGDKFYNWLYDFTEKDKRFIPYIISWQPPNVVPEKVKSQFGDQIKYRANEGCDWGCYNYFVNYLKDNKLTKEYDYIIFIHDDILAKKEDWPSVMINHIDKNPEFHLTSLRGRYIQYPPEDFIKRSESGVNYTKEWMSMCWCARATDFFFENNPIVSIPGRVVDYAGDMGCSLVFANFLNLWGTEKIGWTAYDGVDSIEEYADAVYHGKRGIRERICIRNHHTDKNLQKVNFKLALDYGFKFEKNKPVTHPKLNERGIIDE
jgi:hypothetical protein